MDADAMVARMVEARNAVKAAEEAERAAAKAKADAAQAQRDARARVVEARKAMERAIDDVLPDPDRYPMFDAAALPAMMGGAPDDAFTAVDEPLNAFDSLVLTALHCDEAADAIWEAARDEGVGDIKLGRLLAELWKSAPANLNPKAKANSWKACARGGNARIWLGVDAFATESVAPATLGGAKLLKLARHLLELPYPHAAPAEGVARG